MDEVAVGLEQKGQVRLIDLSKTYGDAQVVKGISLQINQGEFFSILGPSGSGKTTLMMMIAGFVIPSSGQIDIGGRPMAHEPPQRRGLGVVFQNYALFPHLSVWENVAFPLKARKLPKSEIQQRVEATMKLVHLDGFEDRLPTKLSGGQQQRVALARALVFNPDILIMDEPLSALDKKLRNDMRDEIRRLHRHLGVTVIYVTHDQEEALTMSDRVAIMDAGAIEQLGSPKALYDEPASRFVAGFLGNSNFLPAIIVAGECGRMQCSTEDLKFSGLFTQPLLPGTKVVAAIRPERIEIFPSAGTQTVADHQTNIATGTLTNITYAGDSQVYSVALATSGNLDCKVSYDGKSKSISIGESVFLRWKMSDTRIFPA